MRPRTATRRLAPCLIAAAAVLFLDGQASAATCGDYVHIRTPGQQADPTHDPTPPADSPCAHGRCDRLPLAPPAPEPTAPTGGGSSQDAVLAARLVTLPPAAFGYADAQLGVPAHVSSVPFHPPRV